MEEMESTRARATKQHQSNELEKMAEQLEEMDDQMAKLRDEHEVALTAAREAAVKTTAVAVEQRKAEEARLVEGHQEELERLTKGHAESMGAERAERAQLIEGHQSELEQGRERERAKERESEQERERVILETNERNARDEEMRRKSSVPMSAVLPAEWHEAASPSRSHGERSEGIHAISHAGNDDMAGVSGAVSMGRDNRAARTSMERRDLDRKGFAEELAETKRCAEEKLSRMAEQERMAATRRRLEGTQREEAVAAELARLAGEHEAKMRERKEELREEHRTVLEAARQQAVAVLEGAQQKHIGDTEEQMAKLRDEHALAIEEAREEAASEVYDALGAEKATLESDQAKACQALRTEHESALEAVGKANQEAVEKAESSAKQLHDDELSVRLGQLATTHVAQLEAARQEAAAGAVEATTERASLEKAHTAALDEVSTGHESKLEAARQAAAAERASLEAAHAAALDEAHVGHESQLEAVGKANQEAAKLAMSNAKQLHDEELRERLEQLATAHTAELEVAENRMEQIEQASRAALGGEHTVALDGLRQEMETAKSAGKAKFASELEYQKERMALEHQIALEAARESGAEETRRALLTRNEQHAKILGDVHANHEEAIASAISMAAQDRVALEQEHEAVFGEARAEYDTKHTAACEAADKTVRERERERERD